MVFRVVSRNGVAPDDYHGTSVYSRNISTFERTPGYLLRESRMDCVVVLEEDGRLSVKEFRRLRRGDRVACGRRETGEDGISSTPGFPVSASSAEKFAFRARLTRETSFSTDYDELYGLLEHERESGFILWVLGPAVVFDRDAREAFVKLVEGGYVHALHAGNALAAHDLEAALFGTALGQEIYSKRRRPSVIISTWTQ